MSTRLHTYGREPSTRRAFFGRAAALLFLGAVSAGLHVATGNGPEAARTLRAIHRYCYATDTWRRVRMFELRKGDVFRVDDQPAEHAASDPVKLPDGVWSITTDYRIDPATNQWV